MTPTNSAEEPLFIDHNVCIVERVACGRRTFQAVPASVANTALGQESGWAREPEWDEIAWERHFVGAANLISVGVA